MTTKWGREDWKERYNKTAISYNLREGSVGIGCLLLERKTLLRQEVGRAETEESHGLEHVSMYDS